MEYSRQSRASTADYVASDGRVVTHRIGRSDIEIVKLFIRRRYLSAPYIALLVNPPRSVQVIQRRLRAMKRKSVNILQLCERQRTIPAERITGYLYYELAPEGYALLSEEGADIPKRDRDGIFAHTLMLDQAMASLDIGLVRAGATATYEPRKAYDLPDKRRLIPDHGAINLEVKAKKPRISAVEADTGSMPISTHDADRSAIVNKLRDYLYLISEGEIDGYVLFIVRTEERILSVFRELEKLTKEKPSLRKFFLFKTHPVYGKSVEKPRATGHMFEEPFQRCGGYEPVILGQ